MSVAAGYRWHGGLSTLDQGEEPVLLQTADEPRPLSLLLPGLPAHHTPTGPHVPHWCFVAGRVHVVYALTMSGGGSTRGDALLQDHAQSGALLLLLRLRGFCHSLRTETSYLLFGCIHVISQNLVEKSSLKSCFSSSSSWMRCVCFQEFWFRFLEVLQSRHG